MKKLVIDSSVIVKWLNQQNEERLAQADKILNDERKGEVVLFVPELAKYEIGNALLIRKQLSLTDADTTFNVLFALPLHFVYQSEELAHETYTIAQEVSITYYDASFIALAKQERAELVTDNPKHQAKTQVVKVILLGNY